ncbi:hypothetical protein J7T55_008533 [Diaporthe amygdali]|uniref:uncharacterized protein n=1 Tax=Phomopsis amygdali TaxID=1214568 RepID=UPI0022FEE1C8|nr:uncharacterized protein J7T55_008533 [Diaporthe amygdali]KAJ0121369.1 hypothetical protein J7T55_008533 [Diaporthe amygdali]
MPPKTALLRLATRSSSYVCHSCLSSLSKHPAKQSSVRPYANDSKGKTRQRSKAIKPDSEQSTEETREKPYTVKYFEKDTTGEVRQLPVEEDGDDVDMEDIRALEASALAKIEKFDATLESLNNKSRFLERILAKHGPKGAVEAYRSVLETYDAETSTTPIPLVVEEQSGLRMSRAEVQKINKALKFLNNSIERSTTLLRKNQLDHLNVSKVWSYFKQARPVLSDPQRIVPKNAWNDLWAILSWDSEKNPHRMAHIRGLCHAMVESGTELTDEQQLLQIEAAYSEGYEMVAIENWKRLCPTLGSSASSAMAFWELGVRLWSQRGDIGRAERACQVVLDRASASTLADSQVLLYLIRAYVTTPDPAAADKGFKLYRRMRDLATEIEKPMTIEDYDNVISIFLESGHLDYAMYAFTDMIYSGTVNLYGNSKLPSSVRNQFFFGKWLKRLIGARDLDGAYKVLVYMQENGVMAAAVQVNGLIGAWFRSRTAEERKKAELLAWSMVHARKAFVELRQRESSIEWPIRLYDGRPSNREHNSGELDYTMVPRASSETFILLAENYRERGLFGRLEELFVAYKECEIGGDAMMMNELIMAAVEQGNAEKARELYDLMVHEHGILPNTDTYAVLFKSLPINALRGRKLTQIAPHVTAESQEQARGFFRDMVNSTSLYQDRRRTRHGELSEEQVKLMLHSFRKCADWAGVIVALVCLRDLMRFNITRNVLLEMIGEYEGIDRPSPRTSKVVMRTTMKLQTMIHNMQKRQQEDQAQSQGDGTETEANKSPSEVKDPHILYNILLEYYYKKAEQEYSDTVHFRDVFKRAQEEMGASEIAPLELPKVEAPVDPEELEGEMAVDDGEMYKKV